MGQVAVGTQVGQGARGMLNALQHNGAPVACGILCEQVRLPRIESDTGKRNLGWPTTPTPQRS